MRLRLGQRRSNFKSEMLAQKGAYLLQLVTGIPMVVLRLLFVWSRIGIQKSN